MESFLGCFGATRWADLCQEEKNQEKRWEWLNDLSLTKTLYFLKQIKRREGDFGKNNYSV
jgi:hypothetical protein